MIRGVSASGVFPKTILRGLLLLVLFALAGSRQTYAQSTFKLLHTFTGPDGSNPSGDLVRDSAGNLYGVTSVGGVNCTNQNIQGCGTLFQITPSGVFSVLYMFTGGTDGANPIGGLTLSSNGDLFGTTYGGTCLPSQPGTCGSIFKFSQASGFALLHDLDPVTEGWRPAGPLTLDSHGNIYGTTSLYGYPHFKSGAVFKLTPGGSLTVLHVFSAPTDGISPGGRLLLDSAGNLRGTTQLGGTGCVHQSGCGTIFKIDAAGNESIFEDFVYQTGWSVGPSLVQDSAGNFFGTTFGWKACCGTVYKVNSAGVKTVLHTFTQRKIEGAHPLGVVRDAAGNLYGTNQSGGPNFIGTVFKISTAGKETILHNFAGGADGSIPRGSVILDPQGNLYGTSFPLNENLPGGTVFELTFP